MSLFRFIASDYPLLEVNYDGFIEMKVKDIKNLDFVPNPPISFQSWDEMDQESTILYAKDESDLGGLVISVCSNPPYGLEDYIDKEFIYWLEGDFRSKFLNQLTEYVKSNIKKEYGVELWSIWFGDQIDSKLLKKIYLNQFTSSEFKILQHHGYCCLKIE